jgi:hypothetical protein
MRRRFLPDAAPSRGMLKKCSGVRMVTGAFDAVHLYEQFDAVSMIQVIGHLRDPLYAMQILQGSELGCGQTRPTIEDLECWYGRTAAQAQVSDQPWGVAASKMVDLIPRRLSIVYFVANLFLVLLQKTETDSCSATRESGPGAAARTMSSD